jgi:hypothetical protein
MPTDALLHRTLNTSLRISQIFRQLSPCLGIRNTTMPHGFDKHSSALEKRRHFRSPDRGNRIAKHILPRAFKLRAIGRTQTRTGPAG